MRFREKVVGSTGAPVTRLSPLVAPGRRVTPLSLSASSSPGLCPPKPEHSRALGWVRREVPHIRGWAWFGCFGIRFPKGLATVLVCD